MWNDCNGKQAKQWMPERGRHEGGEDTEQGAIPEPSEKKTWLRDSIPGRGKRFFSTRYPDQL